jgi:hypothetical protein
MTGAIFVAFASCGGSSGFESIHVPRQLVLAATALSAWICLAKSPSLDRINIASLLLMAIATSSIVASSAPAISVQQGTVWIAGLTILMVARASETSTSIAWAILGSAGLLCLFACLEIVTGNSIPGRGPAAVLGQRNHLAHFILAGVPAAVILLRQTTNPRKQAFIAAALILLVIVILHTRSRAVWLGTLAFVIVYSLVRRDLKVVGLAALGVIVGLSFPSRLAWKDTRPMIATASRLFDRDSPGGRGRIARWSDSLELLADGPMLGVGPGRWRAEFPRVSQEADSTWNVANWKSTGRLLNGDVVALLLELGGLGLLAFLWLGWELSREAMTNQRSAGGPEAMASLCAFGVIMVFDAALQLPATMFVYAAVIGILLPESPQSTRKLPAPATLFVAALLCTGLLEGGSREISLLTRSSGAKLTTRLAVARWVPGDEAGLFEVIEALVLAGRCEEARPMMGRLVAQLGAFNQVKELSTMCPP